MKLSLLALLMAVSSAACAPVPPPAEQAARTVSCIALDQVAGRRVLADGSLLFEAVGADYRNRLASPCPGAARVSRSAAISIVDSSPGNRLCRGDRVRVFDPVETAGLGPAAAPICVLADFEVVPR